MAFCSVRGIRYQTDDQVCAVCRNELAAESEQKHENHPVNGESTIFNRGPNTDFSGLGMKVDQDPESQLGKGLIKPHSMELEVDGFHFKYDKPLRNFVKPEKAKEKVVEFRVTCPGLVPEASPEGNFREETFINEITQEEIPSEVDHNHLDVEIEKAETNKIEEPAEVEDVNAAMEKNDQLSDKEMWVAGEILADTVGESPLESELRPGFDLPEPELETKEEMVILWEDFKRWFGIPLANQYRISNRSLQIIDRLARKFSEIDLPMISEVTLRQSWLGKIFKTGDLAITVKHLPETGLKLTGIRNPEKVHRLLEELINKTR